MKQRLTPTLVVKVQQALAASVASTEGGVVTYKKGRTDFTVAKATGATLGNVKKVRSELFGQLRQTKQITDGRIEMLEARIEKLEKRLDRRR